MTRNERDFEIRVQGHTLVRVCDGGVRIDGKDFHSDLKSLNDLVDILSNIIVTAQEAGKPRLIAEEGETLHPSSPAGTKPCNLKIVSNA
jgi:hypothetical protein